MRTSSADARSRRTALGLSFSSPTGDRIALAVVVLLLVLFVSTTAWLLIPS